MPVTLEWLRPALTDCLHAMFSGQSIGPEMYHSFPLMSHAMRNGLRLFLAGLLALGISAPDDHAPKYEDLTDQRTLVVIKPGESKEAIVCWRDVPGGRFPVMAVGDRAELDGPERKKLRDVLSFESGGIVVTLDRKRSESLSKALGRDGKYWVVAAAKVAARPGATPGPVNLFVHYVAGTGRTVYRRGAICVLIAGG